MPGRKKRVGSLAQGASAANTPRMETNENLRRSEEEVSFSPTRPREAQYQPAEDWRLEVQKLREEEEAQMNQIMQKLNNLECQRQPIQSVDPQVQNLTQTNEQAEMTSDGWQTEQIGDQLDSGKTVNRSFNLNGLNPLPIDAELKDFKNWCEAWENHAHVQQLSAFSNTTQVYALLSAIGPHTARILKQGFGMDMTSPSATVPLMLETLQKYFCAMRNIAVDRLNFCQRVQGPTEPFDQFRFALNDMADDAEFGCPSRRETLLVTQVIVGIREPETQTKLLQERNFPTMQRAVEICTSDESASRNKVKLADSTINKLSSSNYKKRNQKDLSQVRSESRRKNTPKENHRRKVNHDKVDPSCTWCGGKKHEKTKCPAADKECRRCKMKGHFAHVCRSSVPKTGEVSSVATNEEKTAASCKLRYVTADFFSTDSKERLGTLTKVLPDSGATSSLMSSKDFLALGGKKQNLHNDGTKLKAANNLPILYWGKICFRVRVGDKSTMVIFFVTPEHDTTLLSVEACINVGLIPPVFPNQNIYNIFSNVADLQGLKQELVEDFQDVFDSEYKPLKPMVGDPIVKKLKDNAQPVQFTKPRPIPVTMREKAKELIDELVVKGILVPVKKPTSWVHPTDCAMLEEQRSGHLASLGFLIKLYFPNNKYKITITCLTSNTLVNSKHWIDFYKFGIF